MSNPNSQKAKQLANDLAAMDTYKDHSEYCWSHSSEIIAALRAQQDGPLDRDAVLEEAADLCDQHLDHFSGTECTYRVDVAEAIRALKNAAPQVPDAARLGTAHTATTPDGAAPQQSAGADDALKAEYAEEAAWVRSVAATFKMPRLSKIASMLERVSYATEGGS